MRYLLLIALIGVSCAGADTFIPNPPDVVQGIYTNGNLVGVDSGVIVDAGIKKSTILNAVAAVDGHYYFNDSMLTVFRGETDLLSGIALTTTYSNACLLTPGGNPLSETNRAAVVIPSGRYDLGSSTLVLHTNYVDLVAQTPVTPPLTPIEDFSGNTAPSTEAPYSWMPTTLITGSGGVVIKQTVDDVRLVGFGIVNLTAGGAATLQVDSSGSGTNSLYESLYLHAKHLGGPGGGGDLEAWKANPSHPYGVGGVWKNCRIDQHWFARCSRRTDRDSFFTATMENCHFGQWSVGGDYDETSTFTHAFTNSFFKNCTASHYSFGSCTEWGLVIGDSNTFIDCRAGIHAFGLGTLNEGTFIRCSAGRNSFGGTASSGWSGEFAGYALDCQGGLGSFGGINSPLLAGLGKLSGTLINCTIADNNAEIRCEGAAIDRCNIELDGTHPGSYSDPVLKLLDSSTTVRNSTLLQTTTGGVAIDSDSSMDVMVQNCSLTGDALDPTGLGENVTNLALDSGNSVILNDGADIYNYYVYPAVGANSYTNGDVVSDIMDAIYLRADTTTGATYRIYLHEGDYTFGSLDTVPKTLDSINNLEVIGFPEPSQKSTSYKTGVATATSYYPVTVTNLTDVLMVSTAVTNGQSSVYRNINFFSSITIAFHVSDITFDNCRLDGRVFSRNVAGEYADNVLIKNCDIVGTIGVLTETYTDEETGLLNAHFEKVYLGTSGTINAIPATNTTTYFSRIWAANAPSILYTKKSRSGGASNDTIIDIDNCYLLASGLFDDDVLNSNIVNAVDTVFTGTGAGSGWDVLPGVSTFLNCQGVPFEFTNSSSVMWCTDEAGDVIPNTQ